MTNGEEGLGGIAYFRRLMGLRFPHSRVTLNSLEEEWMDGWIDGRTDGKETGREPCQT